MRASFLTHYHITQLINFAKAEFLQSLAFVLAMSPTQAEVFFNQSIKSFTESVGKVEIVISRAGNLGVASVLK